MAKMHAWQRSHRRDARWHGRAAAEWIASAIARARHEAEMAPFYAARPHLGAFDSTIADRFERFAYDSAKLAAHYAGLSLDCPTEPMRPEVAARLRAEFRHLDAQCARPSEPDSGIA